LSSSSGTDRSRVDERGIDHALLARLIARHGAPPPAPQLSPDDEERREIALRRERAVAAADPALVVHIERHERSSHELGRTQRAALAAHARLAARDGSGKDRLRVREIGEVREIEPSEEIHEAMEHRTPQAFLRDLHRPVLEFGGVQLRRMPSPTAAAALSRSRAAVSEVMSHRARASAQFQLASQLARGGLEELRAILARPWADSRPENPLPMPGQVPGAEDWQWFGLSGGYDPDV